MTKSDEQDLDRAIDLVARRMLDIEPPVGLRNRVLERVSVPRRRPNWAWLAVPAAAMLMLAILWPRASQPTLTSRPVTDYRLPAEIVAVAHPPPPPTLDGAVREPARRSEGRLVHATSIEKPLSADDSYSVPPLAAPSPIAVQTIPDATGTPIGEIAVTRIEIRALQVNALPEAPDTRREE